METILTAEQAAKYAIEKVFPNWNPRELATQVAAPEASYDSKVISWNPVDGAIAYAIFCNGNLVAITSETSYSLADCDDNDVYTIRSANSMGGLGAEAVVSGLSSIQEIENETAEIVNVSYFNLQGMAVEPTLKGVVLKVVTFADGKQQTSKIINR